jgi:hypothetical protein
MMKGSIMISIAACCLAAGCNPTRRIDMHNLSAVEAEITFTIKEDSILVSPFYLSNAEKMTVRLGTRPPYNLAKLSFGIGPWQRPYLEDITDDLEKIEIKDGKGEKKLTSQEEMIAYLSERISGVTRRKIKITIEQ